MRTFEVQSIEIAAPFERVFDYVADPRRLPEWTSAFKVASMDRAVLRTPTGEVEIGLQVSLHRAAGTIDWTLKFPDGSRANAFSRAVGVGEGRTVYTFLLLPPPVPLERLEGTLAEQSRILGEELGRLKEIVSS